ncbi:MAG: hypothetical protein JSV79_09555 [Armatimonadota bacterium]|nr:MAG: hypothetical protein JSV79_09555 [Armatimonadota bacterium]
MKYDSKSRGKLIVLGIILIAVWVVIGLRYVALSRHWEAKRAAEEHAHAAAAASQAASSQEAPEAAAGARMAALVTPVAPPESDPFRPVIPPRTRRAATRAAATPGSESGARVAVPLLPPPISMATTVDRSSLYVTGIIVGTPNTAVLRFEDEHYVVREGYLIDNRIRVQTIGKDSVTLQDSRGIYVLRLGR